MTGENELENINENAAPLEGAEGSAGSSGAEGSDVHPIYEVPKPEVRNLPPLMVMLRAVQIWF